MGDVTPQARRLACGLGATLPTGMCMPELPEVETVVRDLRPHLIGRRIGGIRAGRLALRRPWQKRWAAQLLDRAIQAVDRRGKWIRIDLDGPLLLVHLGMTSQFTVAPPEAPRRDH